jgi:uncharacterized ferritin-like protein (DUF455 family)
MEQKRKLGRIMNRQQNTLEQASERIFSSISQDLCLVKINLATSGINAPPEAKKKIESSHDLVSKAIIDLRQLGNELHDAVA